MYLLDQYRGTVLSCRYEIPPRLAPAESRTQLEQAVKVAVVDTIMRHPMMQVGLIDSTSKSPSWIQLQSLDMGQHIKWVYLEANDDFEQTVQATFCAKLDERFPDLSIRQPGWWITVFRQGDAPMMEVMLFWNHPQFDGVGAKVLHEDFLEMLNADNGAHERTGLDGSILTLPQATPLLPTPIECLNSLPVDPLFLAKMFWDEVRPHCLNRDASQAAWCPIRSTPYKTQYRAFFIDEESLLAILALCRKNKTTITALLHGLALISFSSHLNRAVAPGFQSSTIVDHRRNLSPAPPDAPWGRQDRAVANYVTQAFHRYGPKLVTRIRSKLPADATQGKHLSAELQRELWAASARSRREIVNKLNSGGRNDLVGAFKYVTDWEKTMKGQARKKRQFSWLVTNVGVVGGGNTPKPLDSTTTGSTTNGESKPNDAQRWSIARAQFGVSVEVPSAAILFSPVSVAGRGMCVGATWPDCAVDAVLGDRIMGDMKRWLDQLASQR